MIWRFEMKKVRLAFGAAGMVAMIGGISAKGGPPIFSFETLYNNSGVPDVAGTRPDDFHANGGGTTVTQDTIGATDKTHSMKFTQVPLATFTAALTEVFPASTINDPATTAISLDVTIPDTGAFNGSFADIGITEFGNNPTMGINGAAAQTSGASQQSLVLAPGTHTITIPLIARVNPVTFEGTDDVPFSSIFGPDTNTQLQVPTGFQFYINKSNDSALTVYIDNVHVVPDFLPGDADLNGVVDTVDFNILASNFSQTGTTWTTADFSGDGTTDTIDFNLLASNFGHSRGAGPALGASLVPEPTSLLAGSVLAAGLLRRRPRESRANN